MTYWKFERNCEYHYCSRNSIASPERMLERCYVGEGSWLLCPSNTDKLMRFLLLECVSAEEHVTLSCKNVPYTFLRAHRSATGFMSVCTCLTKQQPPAQASCWHQLSCCLTNKSRCWLSLVHSQSSHDHNYRSERLWHLCLNLKCTGSFGTWPELAWCFCSAWACEQRLSQDIQSFTLAQSAWVERLAGINCHAGINRSYLAENGI